MMMKSTLIAVGACGLIAGLSAQAVAQDGKAQDAKASQSKQGQQSEQSKTAKQQQSDNSNQNQSANGTTPGEPVVLTVTTVAFAESTGCWAKIHDGEDFSGRTLTLMGDQSLPNLEFGVGEDWEGDIDSVEVGPNAKLTLYDDANFADDPRNFGPNARIGDLHKAMFDEGIESLRLACTGKAAAS